MGSKEYLSFKEGAEGKARSEKMALEGFEEVEDLDKEVAETTSGEERKKGNRPDFRVVQPTVDRDGKTIYKSVGAMWKTVSKNGNEFYVLKIGELRLLVFKNE